MTRGRKAVAATAAASGRGRRPRRGAIPVDRSGGVPGAENPAHATLDTSAWLAHDAEYLTTSFATMLRRLPHLLGAAFGLAWRASRTDTVLAVASNLLAGSLTALGVLATRGVAQALLAAGPTPGRVRAAVPSLLVVAAAVAGRAALTVLATWASVRLEPQVKAVVDIRFLELTTSVELRAFDDPSFADRMHRARVKGTESAVEVVQHAVVGLSGIVGVTAAAVALVVVHPLLLPLLLVAVAPVGWASVRGARIEYVSARSRIARRRRLWGLEELMANRRTAAELRSYGMRGFLLDQHGAVVRAETAADLAVARARAWTGVVGGALSGVALVTVYLALGWLLVSGRVPLSGATAAVVALQTGNQALRLAAKAVNDVYESSLYFRDYADFCAEAATLVPPAIAGADVAPFTELTLTGVGLTYPGAAAPAVRDVTLTLRRGETVALVGENGSGKTTLARLVAGLYAPTEGEIRWDGQPVGDLPPDRVRERIAVVSQEYWHWPFTARENIRLGDLSKDPAGVPEAAMATGAHEVIASLPRGYDTLLDRLFAGGQELSGGQWQRLAAARAVFRDAPLLICDEPSAALDARAEHVLFERLTRRDEGRTTILISHRLANVRHADRIYVMSRGRIVEQGTHDELMAAAGSYAELFTLQAAGYQEAPVPG